MKVSIAVLVLFLTSSAQALKVGDWVHYRITSWGPEYKHVSEHVMIVKKVDAAEKKYTVRNEFASADRRFSYDSDYNIPQANRMQNAVASCTPVFAGTIENFATRHGILPVCHFTAKFAGATKDNYYGNVPFGIVKRVSVNTEPDRGSTVELLDYQM